MGNIICWDHYSSSKKYGEVWSAKNNTKRLYYFIHIINGKITASIKDLTGSKMILEDKKVKTFTEAEKYLIHYQVCHS
jgi:hypothetical protein